MTVDGHQIFFNDSLGESDGRRDHRVEGVYKVVLIVHTQNMYLMYMRRSQQGIHKLESVLSAWRAFCRSMRRMSSNNQQ